MVIIEQVRRQHIASVPSNNENPFLPQHFHIYSLHSGTQNIAENTMVCDNHHISRLYSNGAVSSSCDSLSSQGTVPILEMNKVKAVAKFTPKEHSKIHYCTIEGDNVLLLDIGSPSDTVNKINCSYSVSVRHPVEIDVYALANLYAYKPGKVLQYIRGNWPLMCASIEDSLLPYVEGAARHVPVAVDSRDVIRNGKLALSYWLRACNIHHAVVISQRPTGESSPPNLKRSACKVLSVMGVPPAQHVLCLEDALSHVSRSSDPQHTQKRVAVVLASQVGIDSIADAFFGTRRPRIAVNASVWDLFEAVRAVEHVNGPAGAGTPDTTTQITLKIGSMWRYLLERAPSLVPPGSNTDISKDTGPLGEEYVRAGAAAETSLRRLFVDNTVAEGSHESTILLTALEKLLSRCAKMSASRGNLLETQYALVGVFRESTTGPNDVAVAGIDRLLQGDSTVRKRIAVLLGRLASGTSTLEWLPCHISDWTWAYTAMAEWASRLAYGTTNSDDCAVIRGDGVRPGGVEQALCRIVLALTSPDTASLYPTETGNSCVAQPQEIIPVGSGFVLIFVSPTDLAAVKALVSEWYANCPECDPAASYQYLIVSSADHTSRLSKLVIVQALDFIKRVSSSPQSEALVILVGIDAARRFVPPTPGGKGMFKYLSQYSYGQLNIGKGRVAFASTLCHHNGVGQCAYGDLKHCPDVLAFGGHLPTMQRILSDCLEYGGHSDDATEALEAYISRHTGLLMVDSAHNYFSAEGYYFSNRSNVADDDDGNITAFVNNNAEV